MVGNCSVLLPPPLLHPAGAVDELCAMLCLLPRGNGRAVAARVGVYAPPGLVDTTAQVFPTTARVGQAKRLHGGKSLFT